MPGLAGARLVLPALAGARLVLPALLALALVPLTGVGARASLYVVLSASTASPGAVVFGYTPGHGPVAAAKGEMLPLFLIPTSEVEEVESVEDARLAIAGWLTVDRSGDGRASVIVPPLAPGPYTLMVGCEACAPNSGGRSILPVADITIVPVDQNVPSFPIAGLLRAVIASLCPAGS